MISTMMSTSILILIVAKALPLIQKQISSIHFIRLVSMILLISSLLSFNTLYLQSIGSGIGIYSGLFQITNIGQTMEIFLLLVGSIILIGWPSLQNKYSIDYSLIVLFSILGSSLLISSSDLISFYLSLELQSFGLYILSTLYRNSESSTNAGLKYFLLGGLSSCIILLGTGIIYAYTGLTQLESIFMLIFSSPFPLGGLEVTAGHVGLEIISILGGAGEIGDQVLIGTLFGLVLIVIGLLFKISAAPLHNWSPDVYDDTPTIVTIWLTIVPKISLLIFLLELVAFSYLSNIDFASLSPTPNLRLGGGEDIDNLLAAVVVGKSYYPIKNILLISSILSLIIGTVVGLAQVKIKRLLTYSTISHIGFMLLALAINTNQSIDSFLFYLIQYIITNLNIFLILLAISYSFNSSPLPPTQPLPVGVNREKINGSQPAAISSMDLSASFFLKKKGNRLVTDIKYLRELQGLFYNNPILSLSLSLSLFSMAGIPPLVGFFSKQFVLYSALDSGYYFISLVGIIVSVISASYYLKIIKLLHLSNSEGSCLSQQFGEITRVGEATNATHPTMVLTSFHSFIIALLSLFILLFIFKPTLILNSTQVLSLTLFKL